MTNNKTLYIVLVAAVIALVIGGIYWSMQSNNPYGWKFPFGSQSNTNIKSNLSYGELVKLYGNRRIQFDESCELVPNNVTFKNGTTIMLDNRSAKSTTIALDNAKYNISAYGYTIVTLTNASLPHTIMIDCGKGQNNGTIILQQ